MSPFPLFLYAETEKIDVLRSSLSCPSEATSFPCAYIGEALRSDPDLRHAFFRKITFSVVSDYPFSAPCGINPPEPDRETR